VYRYLLRAEAALTVGEALPGAAGLARAAIVAAHRPDALLPALWQATAGRRSAREPIRAALGALAVAVRGAAKARALTLVRAPFDPDALRAACGAAAAEPLAALGSLLWPPAPGPNGAAAFETYALAREGLARPSEAERARRFPPLTLPPPPPTTASAGAPA
jgi:hypothetical protein